MSVYGYVRVSTDRQADAGESLGVQQRVIQGYALQHGWQIDAVFVERGVSGSTPLVARPEGQRLLAPLDAGDIVIIPKLDRMFRSALDALDVLTQLQRRGVSLHMIDLGGDVTGNGISKLVFTILSAVAEAERDKIRERIRDVKCDQAARGLFLGGSRPPFGWAIRRDETGKHLVHEPDEQTAIALMRKWRGKGSSYATIAADIAKAYPDARRLSAMAIKRILDRTQPPGRAA